jgi:C4-dicarboxylate-specific signal transduction histidine kinase
MKTVKVIGVLVLIFAAGFSGGVVATRVVVRRMVMEARRHPDQAVSTIRTNIERNLDRSLDLTQQQQKQVHEILKDPRNRMRPIREQFQPQLDAIIFETRSNIFSTLTPAQQKRFEQFLAQNRQFLPLREIPPPRKEPEKLEGGR